MTLSTLKTIQEEEKSLSQEDGSKYSSEIIEMDKMSVCSSN
jgi:hypothetical protein